MHTNITGELPPICDQNRVRKFCDLDCIIFASKSSSRVTVCEIWDMSRNKINEIEEKSVGESSLFCMQQVSHQSRIWKRLNWEQADFYLRLSYPITRGQLTAHRSSDADIFEKGCTNIVNGDQYATGVRLVGVCSSAVAVQLQTN